MGAPDDCPCEHSQGQSSAPAPSRTSAHTHSSVKCDAWAADLFEKPTSSRSSGVKRDARAAELPDEDEGEGKCKQVKGLTTVDAKEVPCDFSVDDDFELCDTTKGVDEETVRAIWAGKRKQVDEMEAFHNFDVCEGMPIGAKLITTRWVNVPKGDGRRRRFVAREFRHDDPDMEGLQHLKQPSFGGQAGGHACGPTRLYNPVNACFHAEEDEGNLLLASQGTGQDVPRQRRTRGESLLVVEEAGLREEEGCEEVQSVRHQGNRLSQA